MILPINFLPEPVVPVTLAEIPTTTVGAVQLARQLKRLGFRFVGPTIVYAFMQSIGSAMHFTSNTIDQPGKAVAQALHGSWMAPPTAFDDREVTLLIGTNPRWEAPIINARLRKRWLRGGFRVGVVGPKVDLTYRTDYLGAGPRTLQEIADGTHPFLDVLKTAEKPILIVGQGALTGEDGDAVLAAARRIAGATESGLLVLHTAAARVGAQIAQGRARQRAGGGRATPRDGGADARRPSRPGRLKKAGFRPRRGDRAGRS